MKGFSHFTGLSMCVLLIFEISCCVLCSSTTELASTDQPSTETPDLITITLTVVFQPLTNQVTTTTDKNEGTTTDNVITGSSVTENPTSVESASAEVRTASEAGSESTTQEGTASSDSEGESTTGHSTMSRSVVVESTTEDFTTSSNDSEPENSTDSVAILYAQKFSDTQLDSIIQQNTCDLSGAADDIFTWLKEIWITNSSIMATKVEITAIKDCDVEYGVTYRMSDIEEAGFDKFLQNIDDSIKLTYNSQPDIDGYEVDTDETENSEDNDIETIEDEIKDQGCQTKECEATDACHISEDQFTCLTPVGVCELEGFCKKDGFLSTGTSPLCSQRGDYAYCDCDTWGLLDNFYDGEKCVNLSLLILICAGGVGLVLLILLITICCLASRRNKAEKELEQLKENAENDLEYAFDTPQGFTSGNQYNQSWTSQTQERLKKYSDTKEYSGEEVGLTSFSDTKGTDVVPGNEKHKQNSNGITGYENKAYGTDSDSLRDMAIDDVTKTDAYRNFQPDLTNIDTKTQYHIKRPHITLRPQDNYAISKEDDIGFRI